MPPVPECDEGTTVWDGNPRSASSIIRLADRLPSGGVPKAGQANVSATRNQGSTIRPEFESGDVVTWTVILRWVGAVWVSQMGRVAGVALLAGETHRDHRAVPGCKPGSGPSPLEEAALPISRPVEVLPEPDESIVIAGGQEPCHRVGMPVPRPSSLYGIGRESQPGPCSRPMSLKPPVWRVFRIAPLGRRTIDRRELKRRQRVRPNRGSATRAFRRSDRFPGSDNRISSWSLRTIGRARRRSGHPPRSRPDLNDIEKPRHLTVGYAPCHRGLLVGSSAGKSAPHPPRLATVSALCLQRSLVSMVRPSG